MSKLKALLLSAVYVSSLAGGAPAHAQIEPFLSQIMWTSAGFCPKGWAEANGQLLPINQNQALFSLLGTTYGGDGRVNFALPDVRGRALVEAGEPPGLQERFHGERFGAETNTLVAIQIPAHTHSATSSLVMRASSSPATTAIPAGAVLADGRTSRVFAAGPSNVDMGATSISAQTTVNATGGGQPFAISQPSLTLRACIALQGIFPSRN